MSTILPLSIDEPSLRVVPGSGKKITLRGFIQAQPNAALDPSGDSSSLKLRGPFNGFSDCAPINSDVRQRCEFRAISREDFQPRSGLLSSPFD